MFVSGVKEIGKIFYTLDLRLFRYTWKYSQTENKFQLTVK